MIATNALQYASLGQWTAAIQACTSTAEIERINAYQLAAEFSHELLAKGNLKVDDLTQIIAKKLDADAVNFISEYYALIRYKYSDGAYIAELYGET